MCTSSVYRSPSNYTLSKIFVLSSYRCSIVHSQKTNKISSKEIMSGNIVQIIVHVEKGKTVEWNAKDY